MQFRPVSGATSVSIGGRGRVNLHGRAARRFRVGRRLDVAASRINRRDAQVDLDTRAAAFVHAVTGEPMPPSRPLTVVTKREHTAHNPGV
jgi:hypothetical protein